MIHGERKRERDGRYTVEQLCDACGKPIRGEHFTDADVVGATDNAGFYLCSRKRCHAAIPESIEDRRAFYRRR